MSKRYRCAVAALVVSTIGLTTASFSWWPGAHGAPADAINSGALIIDGTELAGPYRLDVVDDQVLLNDQAIMELPPQAPPAPLDLETRHGVIQSALEQYAMLRPDTSRELAANATVTEIRRSNLVESANAKGDDLIEIQFKNQEYPDVLELTVERREPLGPDGRQQILVNHRKMIENFLRADCLVILVDGIVLATEPGTAQDRLDRIRAATAAGLTVDQLKAELRTSIGDSLVATLLAERVAEAGGKAVRP
ncbi:MAG: hypothetical protein MK116_06900 [Phycisphaerales bacterium]|nr:hypothetical protein [Phycisphaerales bacterium]